MARNQARIHTSIWHNEDFLALSANAQRLYMLALSQDDVSFCGVVSYSATRWSRLARNTSIAIVTKGIIELCGALFAVLDKSTEELWIRTYLKHDGVLASPNLIRPMIRDFEAVHSHPIRDAIAAYVRANFGDGLPEGFPQPIPQPLPDGIRAHGAGPLASCLLPLDPSRSSRSTHDGDGEPVETDLDSKNGTKPKTAGQLLERLVEACTARDRDRVNVEAIEVLMWARKHVSDQIVDEAIGYCLKAAKRPVFPSAVANLIALRAADAGIVVTKFAPAVKAAKTRWTKETDGAVE